MTEEYINLREASEILGIAKNTMAKLIDRGILGVYSNPRDLRVKLVKRSEVETLMRTAPEKRIVHQARPSELEAAS